MESDARPSRRGFDCGMIRYLTCSPMISSCRLVGTGFRDYMSKPFRDPNLLRCLSDVAVRPASRDATVLMRGIRTSLPPGSVSRSLYVPPSTVKYPKYISRGGFRTRCSACCGRAPGKIASPHRSINLVVLQDGVEHGS